MDQLPPDSTKKIPAVLVEAGSTAKDADVTKMQELLATQFVFHLRDVDFD